jgi:hypothetical protein
MIATSIDFRLVQRLLTYKRLIYTNRPYPTHLNFLVGLGLVNRCSEKCTWHALRRNIIPFLSILGPRSLENICQNENPYFR